MTGADLIFFRACIAFGNHNNIPLIERQIRIADFKVREVKREIRDQMAWDIDRIFKTSPGEPT